MHSMIRRTVPALAIIALSLAAGACGDDPVAPEPEPEVETMRISIGGQTINVNTGNCAVTGGPIAISANTSFTVAHLGAGGVPDPVVAAGGLVTNVVPLNLGVVTFARTGDHAGTLNRVAAGATTINFELFHNAEGHGEFDCDVAITVT